MIVKTEECPDRRAELINAQAAGLQSVENVERGSHTEPDFLAAIAQDLAHLHGGAIHEHKEAARQVLENAFRSLEREAHADRRPRVIQAA
jgi:hypothetical protein